MAVQTISYSLSDFEPKGKATGLLENNTEKLRARIDFKQFYKDLFNSLMSNGFVDGSEYANHLTNENQETAGILVEAGDDGKIDGFGGTRHNGFFEKKHRYLENPEGGVFDLEVEWYFRTKSPVLGWWCEFTMNIAVRDFQNVEIVEGNSKKVLQQGLWEFRNKGFFHPSQEDFDGLKKKFGILKPFVSEQRMEKIYLNHFMFNDLNHDIDWGRTIAASALTDVLDKYFKNFN